VQEAKEKIEADVAALNAKIQSQLAEKHSLELHCASLGSYAALCYMEAIVVGTLLLLDNLKC
jgi:hypothetical protein